MLTFGINWAGANCLLIPAKFLRLRFVTEFHRPLLSMGSRAMAHVYVAANSEATTVQTNEAIENTHIERTSSQFRQRVRCKLSKTINRLGVLPHTDRKGATSDPDCSTSRPESPHSVFTSY